MTDFKPPSERGPPLTTQNPVPDGNKADWKWRAALHNHGVLGDARANRAWPVKKSMNLNAAQLADLLNYTLGLPRRFGSRILETGISPCVVSTWKADEKEQLAAWCEEVLHVRQYLGYNRRRPPRALMRYADRNKKLWNRIQQARVRMEA